MGKYYETHFVQNLEHTSSAHYDLKDSFLLAGGIVRRMEELIDNEFPLSEQDKNRLLDHISEISSTEYDFLYDNKLKFHFESTEKILQNRIQAAETNLSNAKRSRNIFAVLFFLMVLMFLASMLFR